MAALAERVRLLRVGNGLDPDVTQGPLITPTAVDKVEEHVRDALAKGARAVVGGARPAGAAGNFFEPTVLAGADPTMKVSMATPPSSLAGAREGEEGAELPPGLTQGPAPSWR